MKRLIAIPHITWIAALMFLVACGGGDDPANMTVEQAEAALSGTETSTMAEVAMNLGLGALQACEANASKSDPLTEVKTAIQGQSPFSGCLSFAADAKAGTLTVTFTKCTSSALSIDGSMTVVVGKVSGTNSSVELKLTELSAKGYKLSGTVKLEAGTGKSITATLTQVKGTTPSQQSLTLDGKLTVSQPAAGTVLMDGPLTLVTGTQKTYSLKLKQVTTVVADKLPSAGSVEVKWGKTTLEVFFDAQTPVDHTVDVTVGALTFTDMSIQDLLDLIKGK